MENGGKVPKFRHLTVEERRVIISMHKQNFSHRHIASVLEKSHTCIGKVIRAFKTEGRVLTKPRSGRPKTTTKRTDQQILNLSESNPFLSAPKIQARLTNEAVKPSTSTIRRRLISAGKHGRVARRVPFLNKANIRKRMQFYVTHALKPATYWENVLWTDESMIRMSYVSWADVCLEETVRSTVVQVHQTHPKIDGKRFDDVGLYFSVWSRQTCAARRQSLLASVLEFDERRYNTRGQASYRGGFCAPARQCTDPYGKNCERFCQE